MKSNELSIWVFGDAHVGTDSKNGRRSLADSIRDSETDFEWDVAIDVGDMSGAQGLPSDDEGREVVRQLGALSEHTRESIYNVCGNHDRSGLAEPPAMWWRKWVDPEGNNMQFSGVDSSKRPFPIEGTWERYAFRVGNVLFLMMSDINEPSQSVGRGDLGGNPAGVVSGDTFAWWREMVDAHSDSIIVSVHHYMLKETTVASGPWEGLRRDSGSWRSHYHGYKPQGAPEGASYLYFVDSKTDSGAFESYISEHPGSVDMWLGGHTHTHPDDTYGGRSHVETKWGTHFVNAACLTRYHGKLCVPKSRLITLTGGSDKARIRCFMHTDEFLPKGWYAKDEREVHLSAPFDLRPVDSD